MKKNVYILSAKYAPGHFSHMLAFYELFRAAGCQPLLYIDEGYEPFHQEYPDYSYRYTKENVPADMLLIYNLSPYDSRITAKFKKDNPSMKVFFVYHEPWYGMKGWLYDLLHGNESLSGSIKTMGRYFFARKVLKCSDKVILPSDTALRIYQKHGSKFNDRAVLFPLIFTDECGKELHTEDKQYFSFISTAANAKKFTLFLNYVRYNPRRDPSAKFHIATRTDVSGYLDSELKRLIAEEKLLLVHGHSLSNAEINRAYAFSNCTWMVYARSTQSGALCKSFMFGAPVIASNIGSFAEMVNESSGIVLNDSYTLEDIDRAYEAIKASLPRFVIGQEAAFCPAFITLLI